MTATLFGRIREGILIGDVGTADLAGEVLEEGVAPWEIIGQAIVPALAEVGERYAQGVFFLPEMMVAAKAAQDVMAQLEPHFRPEAQEALGRVVLGTVKGDLHDIGKNIVGIMLRAAGFSVVDLGRDVAPEDFVKAVLEFQPRLVGMSALLSTTMGQMQKTIDALSLAGVRSQVKVLVGGAPVSPEFAQEIGADGYAPDAAQAVSVARELAG